MVAASGHCRKRTDRDFRSIWVDRVLVHVLGGAGGVVCHLGLVWVMCLEFGDDDDESMMMEFGVVCHLDLISAASSLIVLISDSTPRNIYMLNW
ncbi:hypothetical protein Q3G72_018469 [Acer saccharum]|nr:hypothetical protein Q3G72_018469 [Acer saccharum]